MCRGSSSRSRGFGIVEALFAVAVLAIGAVALQQLVARSVATVTAEVARSQAMLAASSLLTDATLASPPVGHAEGATADGLRWVRDVRATPHPLLREVHVAVWPRADEPPCELVEVMRVPDA
jgi:type II secretory pathway pseudopilin PulG